MPYVDCRMGNRHQQSMYSICKIYVCAWKWVIAGPNEPARRGRCTRPWRCCAWTAGCATGISKAHTAFIKHTYIDGGLNGV
jgi:hypothetical protein